ncbi:MAG: HD domain-containing protein [Thermodesulfobacteriota bacterium]
METRSMQIPSRQQCLGLIRQMKMLDHIVAHSFQVCRVAIFLVDHMGPGPSSFSRDLVQAAALLHDITKTRSFTSRENHALTGAKFLSEIGYPEVGHIIEQHVRLDSYAASDFPTEAEIVNYADKRVLHDRIVTLEERMDYILEKYAKGPEYRERLLWLWQKTRELEARLFSHVSFKPEELGRLVEHEGDAG